MNLTEAIRRDEASVRIADDIERDLITGHGGPVAFIIALAKEHAEAAKEQLAFVDPHDARKVSELQIEVWRQAELTMWLRRAIEEGEAAWQRLDKGQREAIVNEISPDYMDA